MHSLTPLLLGFLGSILPYCTVWCQSHSKVSNVCHRPATELVYPCYIRFDPFPLPHQTRCGNTFHWSCVSIYAFTTSLHSTLSRSTDNSLASNVLFTISGHHIRHLTLSLTPLSSNIFIFFTNGSSSILSTCSNHCSTPHFAVLCTSSVHTRSIHAIPHILLKHLTSITFLPIALEASLFLDSRLLQAHHAYQRHLLFDF